MKLIVFDLDGTLIDSARDLADSTNAVVESYGGTPLPVERVAGMIGDGAKLLVQRALTAAGLDPDEPEALDRFRDGYDQRLLAHTRPYDGVLDAVQRAARRAKLAVLTNKPEAPARRLLDALDFAPHVSWLIGGDSTFPRKPDPSSLHHLIKESGAGAAGTLFVGDSMIDVETARRGGVAICVALYGFGQARGELNLNPDERTVNASRELGVLLDAWIGEV